MIRLAVKIAYRGEDFSGSQIQPNARTAEGDILSDLMKIVGLPKDSIDLHMASRTDRAVNALGNVAVFYADMEGPDVLLRALNSVSKGIIYRSYAVVDDDFNPRYANRRTYQYIVPIDGLDVSMIRECAKLFEGLNDLKRFCKSDGKPTTIIIDSIDIREIGNLLFFEFSAKYYLWNMIRRISAALISVGNGNSTIDDVIDALKGADITFGLARADALTLTDVVYDDVDFIVPDKKGYDVRLKEEKFKNTLTEHFFESL